MTEHEKNKRRTDKMYYYQFAVCFYIIETLQFNPDFYGRHRC